MNVERVIVDRTSDMNSDLKTDLEMMTYLVRRIDFIEQKMHDEVHRGNAPLERKAQLELQKRIKMDTLYTVCERLAHTYQFLKGNSVDVPNGDQGHMPISEMFARYNERRKEQGR